MNQTTPRPMNNHTSLSTMPMDGRLETLHRALAVIALVLLPLPGWPASIGLFALLACLLRLPTTLWTLGRQLRMPLFLFFVAWWLIAVLSTTWSFHPNRSLLASPILILIIPALWPALTRPRSFILAMGTGTAIHTGIQLAMWFGVLQGVRYKPMTLSGGLHWYPPFTALWSVAALLLLLGLILTAKSWRSRLVPLLLAMPLPVSLLLSGNRALLLAVPIAIVVLAAQLIATASTRRQRISILTTCAAIIIADISSMVIPNVLPNQRISMLADQIASTGKNHASPPELSQAINEEEAIRRQQVDQEEAIRRQQVDQYVNSVGLRYVWWRAGIGIWTRSPWIGHGAGSTMDQFAIQEARMPTNLGADVEGFITPEPHSALLATAIEQGLLGITLMVSFTVLAFLRAWKCALSTPSLAGLGATWTLVIIFSVAHTLQFSNYTVSLLAVLVALTLPSPKT